MLLQGRSHSVASANLDHAQFSRTFALYSRNSSYLAQSVRKKSLVRQKVEPTGKIASVETRSTVTQQSASAVKRLILIGHFPARMAIEMHIAALRLSWIT
jgi:hypothetical protein